MAAAIAQEGAGGVPEPQLFAASWDDLFDMTVDLQAPFVPEALRHEDAPIYHLDFELLSPAEVGGRVEIRIVNRSGEAWPDLAFHLHPRILGGRMELANVRVNGSERVPAFVEEGRAMRLALDPPLDPGGTAVVSMDLELSLPTEAQRNYSLLGFRDGIVSLAHAYPMLAVYRAGSGWDLDAPAPHGDLGFAEASWFRARIRAPASLVLVASGVETEAPADGAGERVWEVRAGPVRDLYLSLGPFSTLTERVAGTEVRSHHLPGGAPAARRALDHAVRSLEIFGERWTPFPFRTFDMVPLRTEALGVEFPGIIALALRLYERDGGDLPWVVVHEVAHQWFYGIVGNDQITDPWLDEAMAQYAVMVYAGERYGTAEADQARRSFAGRWRSQDADTPIGLPVTAYAPAEYGSVVYGRGPLVVAQIEQEAGPAAFETFVKGYVAAFRWRWAEPQSFRIGAEAACRCSLDDLFEAAVFGE